MLLVEQSLKLDELAESLRTGVVEKRLRKQCNQLSHLARTLKWYIIWLLKYNDILPAERVRWYNKRLERIPRQWSIELWSHCVWQKTQCTQFSEVGTYTLTEMHMKMNTSSWSGHYKLPIKYRIAKVTAKKTTAPKSPMRESMDHTAKVQMKAPARIVTSTAARKIPIPCHENEYIQQGHIYLWCLQSLWPHSRYCVGQKHMSQHLEPRIRQRRNGTDYETLLIASRAFSM